MTEKPNIQEQLVSSSDIAEMLGIGAAAVSNYKARHKTFPKPAYVSTTGKFQLYWIDEIDAWIADRSEDLPAAIARLELQAKRNADRAKYLRRLQGH